MTGTTKGRPRGFDRETALERAIEVFWRHGYDATAVSDLTAAMGINPPSLYAAFGDKRGLFTAAVQRYQDSYGAFTARALAEEATAVAAVRRLLVEAAAEYTDPSHPPGCLVISGATNTTAKSQDVRDELRALREAAKAAVERRIAEGIAAGDLPADTDAPALATFVATVVQGMSQQARDGVTREELTAVALLAVAVLTPG